MNAIPIIDIGPLFAANPATSAITDARIAEAAFDNGFMVVTGHPSEMRVGPAERAVMLKLFDLPMAVQRPLWKRNFAPENPHIYRGWFPLSSSAALNREGFEIGPDIVRDLPDDPDDLLYEPTPLPGPAALPAGWLETARAYYLGMEDIGQRILASLSRSLEIDERIFRDAFDDGISTLRLLHYPKRPDDQPAVEDVPNRFVEFGG
jgi:isopenicillin N synthase-like dioxygenase